MNICDFIGTGRENAVRRSDLAQKLNIRDRKVRRLIEQARKGGALIVNDSSGTGYYFSDDLAELKRQYRTNQHRAMSILSQQKHLRRRIKELGGSVDG